MAHINLLIESLIYIIIWYLHSIIFLMIQFHIILLGKIDVHCIQVNLYIYKQVTLYIVDQPYQNGWSSVSELINNGLVNVLDGLPYRNIWTSISTLYN